jgi:tellurite resistance protein
MFKALKNIAKAAFGAGIEEVTKDLKRDTMEGAMAGAALVIFADGAAEEAEIKKLEQFVSTHPALKAHSTTALSYFRDLRQQFELDYLTGSDLAHKELSEIADQSDKVVVMRLAIMLAKADAEGMEDSEIEAIRAIGQTLGLDANRYLPK